MSQSNGLEQYIVENNEETFSKNDVSETVVETTTNHRDRPMEDGSSPPREGSEEEEEEDGDRSPDPAQFQPQMQSVRPPPSTMIPFTSRSTEADIFAAQRAWLGPDIHRPFGTIVEKSSPISLQASKAQTKSREDNLQPLKCSLCPDWFFSRDKHVVHLISNHGRHHCSYCPAMFDSDESRHEHEAAAHFPLECDVCRAAVQNLDEHYEEVHDMRNCKFCGVLVKPKSYYPMHVRRKHFVTCVETLEERDVRLVGDWSSGIDAWDFQCHLCGKQRKRADIFGHFFSYHRVALLCLVAFLRTEQVLFDVPGSAAPSDCRPVVDDDSSAATGACAACDQPFTADAPKPVHDVRCRGLAVCRVCGKAFARRATRDKHLAAEHASFPCARCDETATNEAELRSHFRDVHAEITCHYCEAFLPNDAARLSEHVAAKHGATVSNECSLSREKSLSNLLAAVDGTAFCGLCDADVTSALDDVGLLCRHLASHAVSPPSVLEFLESLKPAAKRARAWRANGATTTGASLRAYDGDGPASKKRVDVGRIAKPVPSKKAASRKIPLIPARKLSACLDGIGRDTVIIDATCKPPAPDADDETPGESSADSTTDEDADAGSSSEPDDDGREREMDMTEIECVMNDTSDDEYFSEDEALDFAVKQEPGEDALDLRRFVPPDYQSMAGKTDKSIELMDGMFEAPPRTEWADDSPAVEESDSKENSDATNTNHAARNGSKPNGRQSIKPDPEPSGTFRCELCAGGKATAGRSAGEYVRHMAAAHGITLSTRAPPREEREAVGDAFRCPFCAVTSAFKSSVRQHVSDLHAEQCAAASPAADLSYNCRYCDETFWRAAQRNDHQIAEHADRLLDFYKCYVCAQVFSSKLVLTRHAESAHPTHPGYSAVAYKCRPCLSTHASLDALRRHVVAEHPAAMLFPCRLCAAQLKTRKMLRSHIKNAHSTDGRRGGNDCRLCGKLLSSKRAHAIHFRMKHSQVSKVGFRCRICKCRFDTKDDRKMHYTMDHPGESPYHCSECGKGFASKSGMYGHKQLHTGSGVSKCQYCGKEFTRKDSYNEHLLIHNGPRHKCPHCPKEFVQRSNLVRHIRIHTGEKPYKCLYCDKCFSDKGACNSHIRVHTREEMCSCPYCGQIFSKKQKLKYHIRKHTGEGLINCEVCSKSFTNSFALKEHRLIHNRETTILCGTCGKGFNSEKYLQRHVAIVHEPQRTFVCPLCGKEFSQQTRLKSHLMTHTGVKHMKCLLCDKAYSVRKSLRRHLLDKHQVAPEHPNYKRCFYAMSHQEAGLEIPADMSYFVSYDGDGDGAVEEVEEVAAEFADDDDGKVKSRRKPRKLAAAEPSTSRQRSKTSASATFHDDLLADDPSSSSDEPSTASESEGERREPGISNIVDRLQKRLGPGKKAAASAAAAAAGETGGEEPVLARMAALNGPGRLPAVGRRSLCRKPVPERIPRKARGGRPRHGGGAS